MAEAGSLGNPIINSPFEPPNRHFQIGPNGPTGEILLGRRPSESFIPVPASRKGRRAVGVQLELDLDLTGERREANSLINDVRREVERWRANNWNGVTPYSRKLLQHWAAGPPERDDPVFFCQREAAETAIFLAEVAGRHGTADYRRRIDDANKQHNDGLPRVALKMATGAGKTVVMAMLIAWQTVNKVMQPRDARFVKRFLVVAPGITIRDRLGVLLPERDDSYYRQRDLVPPDLWEALLQAQVEVVNYHVFLPRDAKEIQGVASGTRALLRGDKVADAFQETGEQVAERILRGFSSTDGGILVLNDEAHHCYQDKLLDGGDDEADREDRERNRDARVWFKGLLDLARKTSVKTVYDLSATPYYLKGSGYNEGYIFPWTVSDFSLMDAIESGIVKIPRIPVDDDAASTNKQPIYLDLWDNITPVLPATRRARNIDPGPLGWPMPVTLEGALRSLYKSYEASYRVYEKELAAAGEPPPVMIVVCPNTVVSKLMFGWIAGREVVLPDGSTRLAAGSLDLFSNVAGNAWLPRQRTILVDSVQLESGEPLGADFRKDAAAEIEAFQREYRRRNPGADAETLTDADLLREAMNTIGKKGKLGEHIRCVVSVSMLTEGWDANTVTHILGVRPFRSQLLCEQVVGRGLRRRTYATNEDGLFEPEYAEVYGVPFAFIPSDRPMPKPKMVRPAVEVCAEPSREHLAIRFPKLDGYRIELADEPLLPDFDRESRLHLDQTQIALWVQSEGVIGGRVEVDDEELRSARTQRIAFSIAKRLMQDEKYFAAYAGDERPWLFPQLVAICREWLDDWVTTDPDVTKGQLLLAQAGARAAEIVYSSIVRQTGNRTPVLMPVVRRADPEGSTRNVYFQTRKAVMSPPPDKSHVNHVVLDGVRGNSWEEAIAEYLEGDKRVYSYVKNERLGFTIPYVHEGRSHDYIPDFLVRLVTTEGDVDRTLIVEVSGSRKSPGPTHAKAHTAKDQWCVAVNNWGAYGRWGYVEVTDPTQARARLHDAINSLYADRPIIGQPA